MGELLKYPRKAVLLVVGSHSIKTGSVSVIRRISVEDKLLTLFVQEFHLLTLFWLMLLRSEV